MVTIPGQTYLNPINKMKWQEAIRSRKPFVLIGNRRFDLTYFREMQHGTSTEKVSFKPSAGELVPCGIFDIRTVLDETWLTAEN